MFFKVRILSFFYYFYIQAFKVPFCAPKKKHTIIAPESAAAVRDNPAGGDDPAGVVDPAALQDPPDDNAPADVNQDGDARPGGDDPLDAADPAAGNDTPPGGDVAAVDDASEGNAPDGEDLVDGSAASDNEDDDLDFKEAKEKKRLSAAMKECDEKIEELETSLLNLHNGDVRFHIHI